MCFWNTLNMWYTWFHMCHFHCITCETLLLCATTCNHISSCEGIMITCDDMWKQHFTCFIVTTTLCEIMYACVKSYESQVKRSKHTLIFMWFSHVNLSDFSVKGKWRIELSLISLLLNRWVDASPVRDCKKEAFLISGFSLSPLLSPHQLWNSDWITRSNYKSL